MWAPAACLLERMRQGLVLPDLFSYSSSICAELEWTRNLETLRRMKVGRSSFQAMSPLISCRRVV